MPTVSRTLDIARVSQYLASHDVSVQEISRITAIDRELPITLYIERKIIKWIYDEDSSYDGLQAAADYLYSLCWKYSWRAVQIIDGGSGGQVAPATGGSDFTFRYLIPITAADFADATNYNNPIIAGRQLEVFWKNIPNYATPDGWQVLYTPTGFEVFLNDGSGGNAFNATTTNADALFDIYIVNPVTTAVTQNSRTDVLTANDSVITNITAGTSNTDLYTISIIPGGYTYIFGSIFEFGDTPPRQMPNADGTLQIFTFQWNNNISKWVNITQSLNLPYTA